MINVCFLIEKVISSWNSFQSRLRELSSENLKRLKLEQNIKRPFCKHKNVCSLNAIRGFIKTFVTAYAVKYGSCFPLMYCLILFPRFLGLGFLPALLMGKLFKQPNLLYKLGGKDTIRFALFMASFTTTFKAALCSMRRLRNKTDWLNSFVAGFAAGSTIYLDSNHSRRIMIALYLTTRSAHFMSRYLWRHYLEPQWDPHARTREAFAKNKSNETVAGTPLSQSRDLGKLRSPSEQNSSPTLELPTKKSILIEFGDDYDLSPVNSQDESPDYLSAKDIPMLSPIKKARINWIRKFFRQSAVMTTCLYHSPFFNFYRPLEL